VDGGRVARRDLLEGIPNVVRTSRQLVGQIAMDMAVAGKRTFCFFLSIVQVVTPHLSNSRKVALKANPDTSARTGKF